MYYAAATAGCGQAVGLSGAVWEWVSLSEMRVCAGAAAGICEAAGGFLPRVPGALRQYGAVYAERGGWAGLSSGLGDLCSGLFGLWGRMWFFRIEKLR